MTSDFDATKDMLLRTVFLAQIEHSKSTLCEYLSDTNINVCDLIFSIDEAIEVVEYIKAIKREECLNEQ